MASVSDFFSFATFFFMDSTVMYFWEVMSHFTKEKHYILSICPLSCLCTPYYSCKSQVSSFLLIFGERQYEDISGFGMVCIIYLCPKVVSSCKHKTECSAALASLAVALSPLPLLTPRSCYFIWGLGTACLIVLAPESSSLHLDMNL